MDSFEQRQAAARRYLATVPVMDDLVQQIATAVGASPARLLERLRPHGELIEQAFAEGLIRHMDVAEIDALAQFTSSPAGRSVLPKLAAMTAELTARLQPILAAAAREALE